MFARNYRVFGVIDRVLFLWNFTIRHYLQIINRREYVMKVYERPINDECHNNNNINNSPTGEKGNMKM